MSQHRKDTPREPSIGWVALYSAATAVSVTLVLRVIGDRAWTWVHLVAVVFGLFTAAVLSGLAAHTISQRVDARTARERLAERERRTALAEHAQRVANTGTWRGEHVGQVLTVRWDPASRTYWVRGWISDHWQQREERPWADLETLAATLTELEATEMQPGDDEGTRMVRSRLDLPGWDDYGTAEPVFEEPDPTADTQVIRMTDAGLPAREPGAALRPMGTPVFRDQS